MANNPQTTTQPSEVDGELAFQQLADQYIGVNNYDKAVETLENLVAISTRNLQSFYLGFEVKIYRQLGKPDKAIEAADKGLRYNSYDYVLLQQKAEVLFERANNLTEIDEAVRLTELAESYFDQYSKSMDISTTVQDLPSLRNWVLDIMQMKSLLSANKLHMKAMRNIYDLYIKSGNLEEKMEREKVRQFEILTLFSAVIAMIISNIQMVPKLELKQILVLNAAMMLAILGSLSLGSLILNVGNQNQPFLKTWKFWAFVCVCLVGYILYRSL